MEHEKKFLIWENGLFYGTSKFFNVFESVDDLREKNRIHGIDITQGYIPLDRGEEIAKELSLSYRFRPSETRIRNIANTGYSFSMKDAEIGSRNEENVELTEDQFNEYFDYVENFFIKRRLILRDFLGYDLEIDVFKGLDLIIIEVEVDDPQKLSSVPIYGRDVTNDERYYGRNLAKLAMLK